METSDLPADIDVFISYAHIDNEPLTEGQKGWITLLHNSLQVRLRQLMGCEVTIWRDDRLTGNDEFSPVIYKQFERTRALVSILSPRYLKSEWCLNEVQAFLQAAQGTGGIAIDDATRIFKVVKTFVPRKEHPPELQNVLGYEFYQLDPSSGRPHEFLLDMGPEAAKNYWSKLEDLAYDIHGLLKKVPHKDSLLAVQGSGSGPVVYLAESTSDVSVERDRIRRELVGRGCTVFPRVSLPLQVEALERDVSEALEGASMFIQILGERFGIVPEGDERSISRMQYDIAAKVSRPDFSRVSWSASGLQPQDERQKAFLTHIRNSLSSRGEDEYLETSIEELRNFLLQRLLNPGVRKSVPEKDGPRLVYLICDRKDIEASAAIYDALFEAGFEVVLPAFEGDDAEISKNHIESLTSCDAAILHFGSASEIWIRTKLRDLQKAAGYGRTKEWLATAVYIAGPPSPAKTLFRSQSALVIRGGEKFDVAALQPFVDQLQSTPPRP